MAKTAKSRKRWKLVGGIIFGAAFVTMIVLTTLGVSLVTRAIGLAVFFLLWPLIFLVLAPPAKPGLDPVTGEYYKSANRSPQADPHESTTPNRSGNEMRP